MAIARVVPSVIVHPYCDRAPLPMNTLSPRFTHPTDLETLLSDVVALDHADRQQRAQAGPKAPLITTWLITQSLNVGRHAAALKPFRDGEFGTELASPSRAHVQAVNQLMQSLREQLHAIAKQLEQSAQAASQQLQPSQIQRLLLQKETGGQWVKRIEKIWDFYFEIFTQRQSRFGPWLLGCDRIALDSYQVIYTNLGAAQTIPTPGPFSYMETGFSPATFRRGIRCDTSAYEFELDYLLQNDEFNAEMDFEVHWENELKAI
ncbi:MAG: hypothetical protein AAF773_07075 [Cyanobacteria bacterium P01_D01_bin.115]